MKIISLLKINLYKNLFMINLLNNCATFTKIRIDMLWSNNIQLLQISLAIGTSVLGFGKVETSSRI